MGQALLPELDAPTGRDQAPVGGPWQTLALFDALEARVAGKGWRGCAFINAAIELPDATHPAHVVIAEHKARLRERMEKAARADGVDAAAEVAEVLHLLFEGAIVASLTCGTPAPVRAARSAAARLVGAGAASRGAGAAGHG